MAEENQEPLTYTPMSDAYAVPEEKKEIFNSDMDGIQSAAKELEETRAETDDTIHRRYVTIGGEHDGKPVPENQSIDLKRAVDDIARQRGFEAQAAEQQSTQALAESVDQYRAEQQQQQQPQQQAQPEPQPQPQIPADQIPPGVDIEVVTALQNNPKLRAAVEKEVVKADQARQAYAVATQQAAQVAVANILADYPEIAGLNAEQIPVALQILQASNPERAAQLQGHLSRAEQIHKPHEQARGQQAQVMAAAIQHWTRVEDQKMDSFIATEPPETVRAVKDNLIKVAAEVYGISKDELAHAFATTPILRAAPFQKMLYDLVKHHTSVAQMSDKKYRDAPPVMRPRTSSDRPSADDAETSAAYKAFLRNPDPRSAARFLAAKRSVRR